MCICMHKHLYVYKCVLCLFKILTLQLCLFNNINQQEAIDINYSNCCVHCLCLFGWVYVFYVDYETLIHIVILSKHHRHHYLLLMLFLLGLSVLRMTYRQDFMKLFSML
jgi:hypothetical protein